MQTHVQIESISGPNKAWVSDTPLVPTASENYFIYEQKGTFDKFGDEISILCQILQVMKTYFELQGCPGGRFRF